RRTRHSLIATLAGAAMALSLCRPVRADLVLPYAGTVSSAGPAFGVTNNGGGPAIQGKHSGGIYGYVGGVQYGAFGQGVYGLGGNSVGAGVYGESSTAFGIGVRGYNAHPDGGTGLYGLGTSFGAHGITNNGVGVQGDSFGGIGVIGTGVRGVQGEGSFIG